MSVANLLLFNIPVFVFCVLIVILLVFVLLRTFTYVESELRGDVTPRSSTQVPAQDGNEGYHLHSDILSPSRASTASAYFKLECLDVLFLRTYRETAQ